MSEFALYSGRGFNPRKRWEAGLEYGYLTHDLTGRPYSRAEILQQFHQWAEDNNVYITQRIHLVGLLVREIDKFLPDPDAKPPRTSDEYLGFLSLDGATFGADGE